MARRKPKWVKKLVGGTRLALAQFRELAAFSQFASDLDEVTRKQLERGERLTELLKQNQYEPLSVGDMAIVFYVADKGYFDHVPRADIVDFNTQLLNFSRNNHADIINDVTTSGDYSEAVEAKLKQVIDAFLAQSTWPLPTDSE